ncbi:hypothetical protein F442_13501 [Phytophthora nicotianae P10297]|uniref:Uncharacterized protein n=2 Tax=Phytophthora nicotianae TaxID=4792 RepID=V9ESP4_PHYNI|nr:hypothetical protein F443_13642 [Phytophthora nicotianae P1569]ETP39008.1 hypothetical protein F442_13501 [Phytophthora nicotianae P10297]
MAYSSRILPLDRSWTSSHQQSARLCARYGGSRCGIQLRIRPGGYYAALVLYGLVRRCECGTQMGGDGRRVAGGITTTSVTITKHTLRNVFPHLRTTDNSDRNDELAEQLLNQRLVLRGSTCFEWDDSSRMTRVVSQSDMLSPMLQLLNSVEGVFGVFEQALISPEFQWQQTLYYNAFPLRCSANHSSIPKLHWTNWPFRMWPV